MSGPVVAGGSDSIEQLAQVLDTADSAVGPGSYECLQYLPQAAQALRVVEYHAAPLSQIQIDQIEDLAFAERLVLVARAGDRYLGHGHERPPRLRAAKEGQSLDEWVSDARGMHVGELFNDRERERAERRRDNPFVGLLTLLLSLKCSTRMVDLPRNAPGDSGGPLEVLPGLVADFLARGEGLAGRSCDADTGIG